MGIEERWREPRRGVAVAPFCEGVRSERGVSRSLRNWALFMLYPQWNLRGVVVEVEAGGTS